jgi:site-specific DNA-cytosine methylase
VKVPGDVDILIAGTSCVDFSNLNNKQKTLEDGGESGDTFLGMMAWVNKHRPLIVIQENVCNAAWSEMRHYYIDRGYAAEYTRLDSKFYYIPHTRTRGYLCAVNVKGSDISNKWIDAVTKMRRKCTTTLEAYMLPDDDPRVYKARMELAGDPRRSGPLKARTVDWEKCESRHQRERIVKKLGEQRPVTAWQEGGVCKTLDFMWQDWGRKQVERVLDLMDINFLLSVRDSKYDPMYKA